MTIGSLCKVSGLIGPWPGEGPGSMYTNSSIMRGTNTGGGGGFSSLLDDLHFVLDDLDPFHHCGAQARGITCRLGAGALPNELGVPVFTIAPFLKDLEQRRVVSQD